MIRIALIDTDLVTGKDLAEVQVADLDTEQVWDVETMIEWVTEEVGKRKAELETETEAEELRQ